MTESTVSLKSPRESIRWLMKTGRTYMDKRGLAIPRHENPESDALTVDEVLTRLEVLGIPMVDVRIAILPKPVWKNYHFEVRVSGESLRALVAIYPTLLQPALDGLAGAGESPLACRAES